MPAAHDVPMTAAGRRAVSRARAVTLVSRAAFILPSRDAARRGVSTTRAPLDAFLEQLRTQRLDDHRFYHQSRINQSLHFVSAICFIVAYVLLLVDPASAALLAWGVSMTTRQAGHFFFEPRGYDEVNGVTDAYKEAVKVGYNVRRKVALMAGWAIVPVVLAVSPSLGGTIEPAVDLAGYLHDLGIAWLALAVAGIVLRVAQLWIERDLRTGLVWVAKIASDPFCDAMLYHKAPLALMRGELLDPMHELRRR
jgi:hypothetical protein